MPSSQRYNANYCKSKGHDKYQDKGQCDQPARAARRGSPEAVDHRQLSPSRCANLGNGIQFTNFDAFVDRRGANYDDRQQWRSTHSATTEQSLDYFYKITGGDEKVAEYRNRYRARSPMLAKYGAQFALRSVTKAELKRALSIKRGIQSTENDCIRKSSTEDAQMTKRMTPQKRLRLAPPSPPLSPRLRYPERSRCDDTADGRASIDEWNYKSDPKKTSRSDAKFSEVSGFNDPD